MIVLLIDRKTGWLRLVDKFGHLCRDFSLAGDFKESVAEDYAQKFTKNYRIYLTDKDGVVLKKYG